MLYGNTQFQRTSKFRIYQDLIRFETFSERLLYLVLDGDVGTETFGGLRGINQKFYNSTEWNKVRLFVIARDDGCDLGILDRPIHGPIFVHHMNPITPDVLRHDIGRALDPDFLITVSDRTHRKIHYGIPEEDELIVRFPGDTKLW